MKRLVVRAAWWVLLVLSVGGAAIAAPHSDDLQNQSFIIPQMACTVVGAFVAWRRPSNPVGWVLLAGGAMSGLVGMGNSLSVAAYDQAPNPGQPVPWWGVLGAWLYSWLWFPLLWTMSGLLFLVYPDGLPSRRWRPVLVLSAAVVGFVAVGAATYTTLTLGADGDDSRSRKIPNPVGIGLGPDSLTRVPDSAVLVAEIIAVVLIVLSAASLFVRARHATPVVRLQLRWFGFGAAAFVAIQLLQIALGDAAIQITDILFSLSLAMLPIACGFAILRYRLYDIDRVISRTAAYAIVTALVVGVYAALVTSASALIGSQSGLVVAAATLAAAALFRPLLGRVQRVVDRRFNREKVDGQRAIDAFGASLVDEVDPDHARGELLVVTHHILAPERAALWIPAGHDG